MQNNPRKLRQVAVPVGDGEVVGLASGCGLGLADGEGDGDGERTGLPVPCGEGRGRFPRARCAPGGVVRTGGALAVPLLPREVLCSPRWDDGAPAATPVIPADAGTETPAGSVIEGSLRARTMTPVTTAMATTTMAVLSRLLNPITVECSYVAPR